MAYGASQTVIVKIKEEGFTEFTKKVNGVTTQIKQLQQTANGSKTTITNFGQQVEKGANASSKMGNQLKGLATRFVGLQMIVGYVQKAIQNLTSFVIEGIQKWREFEYRLAEVHTLLDGFDDTKITEFGEGIENLSVRYGKSVVDLTKGLYDILSAAIEASEAMRLLNTAVKASIAGISTVEKAVDILTTVINSYGFSVAQASRVSDVLFTTVRRGKLVFEDLESALGYIVPIAASLGVSFDEVAASLSTATRMGLHVDMASRGLALTLQNIANPTEKASKAAEKYGVNLSQVALHVKGFEHVLKDLSDATEEYGDYILSQMIANMRSFRVVAALASEEGIAGLTTDLQYLEKATGATEKAMSKMMNTTKMEADILTQSLEKVQREIGEAWSDIDIWFKKTQLWWGTLLAGGDADAAVARFENYVDGLEQHYINLQKIDKDFADKPSSLFKYLMGVEPGKKGAAFKTFVDFEKIEKYMELSDSLDLLARKYDMAYQKVKKLDDAIDEVIESGKKSLGGDIPIWGAIVDWFGAGGERSVKGTDLYKDVTAHANKYKDAMGEIQWEMEGLQPYMDYFLGSLDDATQYIADTEDKIIDLKNAIHELSEAVEGYTDAEGNIQGYQSLFSKMHSGGITPSKDTPWINEQGGFKGTLGYEIGVFQQETKVRREQQYINMAIKHGAEYQNEYTASMNKHINAIRRYNDVQKEAKKVIDEVNTKLKEYQLQIMEIQLKGMQRRRGLTRSEERQIKKIQINEMRERIKLMKNESVKEAEVLSNSVDEHQYAIQKYLDAESHKLWEMKDIRDSEFNSMKAHYKSLTDDLTTYRDWLTNKEDGLYVQLENAQRTYYEMLKEVNPKIASQMHETFGISIPLELANATNAWLKYWSATKGQASTPEWLPDVAKNVSSDIMTPLVNAGLRGLLGGGFRQRGGMIPSTGMYVMHKGEHVSPRGSNPPGGNTININVNTHVANVSSDVDVNRIARTNARIIASELQGKYGMR